MLIKKKMILLSTYSLKMIQRIQSLYLLMSAIISGGLIFVFNLWEYSQKEFYALDLLVSDSIVEKIVPVLFLSTSLLSIVAIFKYSNRQLQFVIGRVVILINLFLLGVLVYLSLNLPGEVESSKKGIGMFLPMIVILFVVFANKAIKKDEDLVKSVDRLR